VTGQGPFGEAFQTENILVIEAAAMIDFLVGQKFLKWRFGPVFRQ
jgi:hypothetical protein